MKDSWTSSGIKSSLNMCILCFCLFVKVSKNPDASLLVQDPGSPSELWLKRADSVCSEPLSAGNVWMPLQCSAQRLLFYSSGVLSYDSKKYQLCLRCFIGNSKSRELFGLEQSKVHIESSDFWCLCKFDHSLRLSCKFWRQHMSSSH